MFPLTLSYPILSYFLLSYLLLSFTTHPPIPPLLLSSTSSSFPYPLMQRALSDSCVRRAATIYEVIFMDYTMPIMVRDPANSTRLSLHALTNRSLLLSFSSLSSTMMYHLLSFPQSIESIDQTIVTRLSSTLLPQYTRTHTHAHIHIHTYTHTHTHTERSRGHRGNPSPRIQRSDHRPDGQRSGR